MSYSWEPIKAYMLAQPVRWYDCDGQILFPKFSGAVTITTRALAFIVDIDEINEKLYCLATQISPLDDWGKLIDLVVQEFIKHKSKYELPWDTLDGKPFPEPIGIVYRYNKETDQDEYTIQ